MKLIESILTKNPCFTAGRIISVKGLMLHSVGCPQPKATVFINSWNRASYDRACVHGFIDGNDGTVYQTLPWNQRGWHCGGSGNNTHIGVEMCEPACITYNGGYRFTCANKAAAKAVAKRTYDAAVELFAMLCTKYNLKPMADGVIISHKEGHDRGIASNHGDPEHLWTQLGMGYTMDTFRKAVKEKMSSGAAKPATKGPNLYDVSSKGTAQVWYRVRKIWEDAASQKGAFYSLENAKKCADSHEGYSVFDESGKTIYTSKSSVPYLVRIAITDLNIRKGPDTNYDKVGMYTGKGTFTIVEEVDGKGAAKWGLLKYYEDKRDGWICLDYATKV